MGRAWKAQSSGAQFDCATEISVENSVVNSVEFLGFLVLHFYNSVEFLGFYNLVAFLVEQSNCAPAVSVGKQPTKSRIARPSSVARGPP